MAKGQNKIQILGSAGYITGQTQGMWDFVYATSTTKDPLYNVGDVAVAPSRGIFVYSKSAAACISGQGCEFTSTGYVAITTFTTASAVYARSVTVPAATHAALALDELRNGFIVIYDGTTNSVQFRQILGNAAAVANAAFVVNLDGPLSEAVTTSSKCEVFQNPFAALQTGASTALAKAGVPAAKVTAANTYFWCQVGRVPSYCWLAPQSSVGAAKQQGCFWRHDGSLQDVGTALAVTVADNQTGQYAGNCVEGSASGNGPLFMLA
jgi:hypothetical protein